MPPKLHRLIILLAIVVVGCERTGAPPAQTSPGGSLTLTTSVNQSKADPARYLCVIVQIANAAGKTVHREVTPASDTQRWSIEWISDDFVLLKSSDIGRYEIHRQPDGTWNGAQPIPSQSDRIAAAPVAE